MADTLGRRWQVERVVEERTSALNTAITSLAEVHRGLEESEARYRRLVEDSPNAIVVERQGKIVLVNRAAVEMFGFDATLDVEDHNLTEFVVPGAQGNAAEKLVSRTLFAGHADCLRAKPAASAAMAPCLMLRSPPPLFFMPASKPFRSCCATSPSVSGTRPRMPASFSAIEQVAESIVITDLDAKIVYVNPAFERITGYSREEVLGKNPRILKSGQPCRGILRRALECAESR